MTVDTNTPAVSVLIAHSRPTLGQGIWLAAMLVPALYLLSLTMWTLADYLGPPPFPGWTRIPLSSFVLQFLIFCVPAVAVAGILVFRGAGILRAMRSNHATVGLAEGAVILGGLVHPPQVIGEARYASIDAHPSPFRAHRMVSLRTARGIPIITLDPDTYGTDADDLAGRLNAHFDPEAQHIEAVHTPICSRMAEEVLQQTMMFAWKVIVAVVIVVGVAALHATMSPSATAPSHLAGYE